MRVTTDFDTDWGKPQFNDPQGEEYVKVYSSGKASLAMISDRSLLSKLIVRVLKGGLKKGEKIFVIFGDKDLGGAGSRAQTFVEDSRLFRVSVDVNGSGNFVDLPESPTLKILGGAPFRMVVIAPSIINVKERFNVVVKVEDKWGNPSSAYHGKISFSSSDLKASLPPEYVFKGRDRGIHVFSNIALTKDGVHEVMIEDLKSNFFARSNPILAHSGKRECKLFWGDLHGQVHSSEKANDYFRYARDVSIIDFTSFQRNDYNITKKDWNIQQETEKRYNEPGHFIVLPGYEWSADYEGGGHHNVYFPINDQPIRRSGHWNIRDKSDLGTDLYPITKLYEAYRDNDIIIIPHVGGVRANLNFHDPKLEPLIEVSSTHGTFEWFLEEAITRGYRIGFVAGSDGHMGRPGGSYPGFNDRRYAVGGLTAIYSEELDRKSLWKSLKARRCYGTTGARIILRFESDQHLMGEEFSSSNPPKFKIFIAGTNPLERVELMRGLEVAYSYPIETLESSNEVRILWEGASRKTSYSGITWNGTLLIENGEIGYYKKIRFDSPRSNVLDNTKNSLKWYSITCGYTSGLIIGIEGEENSKFTVNVGCNLVTGPRFGEVGTRYPLRISQAPAEEITASFNFSDLKDGPIQVEIGDIDRRLTFSRTPKNNEFKRIYFEHVDHDIKPGWNAYYVRATQIDMEKVWSSPIYINYLKD